MGNRKKTEQLGMPFGTATNRLRKMVMFSLLPSKDCYRCGSEIETVADMSMEHIVPWLDSKDPVELFFDIENITFSHLSCNIASARKTLSDHGAVSCFDRGCRCNKCKKAKRAAWAIYQPHRKSRSRLAQR